MPSASCSARNAPVCCGLVTAESVAETADAGQAARTSVQPKALKSRLIDFIQNVEEGDSETIPRVVCADHKPAR
jgi:hypothetical protein